MRMPKLIKTHLWGFLQDGWRIVMREIVPRFCKFKIVEKLSAKRDVKQETER